jgi:hypothetical protein
MATLWVPGSTLKWLPTLTPPVLTVPTAGVITYTTQQGSYRYIGNEVVYSVNLVGTVATQQINPLLDMTLNLPYPTAAANYPVATIIGELWLNTVSVDGASSNAFKAYGRCAGAVDSSSVTVRFLSGTTDASFGVLTSGTRMILQGQLTYNTPLIANANGVPPNYIPAQITQDQIGRVGINMGGHSPTAAFHVVGDTRIEGNLTVNGTQTMIDTNVNTTERLEITNDGTGPALKVNQKGTQPVIDIQDDGVTVLKVKDGGDMLVGAYTSYVDKLVPAANGRINGVNITALNARTRTSGASAVAAVSTWTARTTNDNNWRSVCWSSELSIFVAVALSGTGNRVMTSSDGITWTSRTSAADNTWLGVCWASELSIFVAVAESGTGNRVMTSFDGVTWTTRTSAADNNWFSVCWAPELSIFVAVAYSGSGNRVMTSPNGITWTTQASAANNSWMSVCWSPELSIFVAVAQTGASNRVMTSFDGITWTSRISAADIGWRSVCWSPELSIFVAVAESGAGNRVMTSPDGITWTSRTSAADNFWSNVCWSPELSIFVAVAWSGTGNRVMTSPDGMSWTVRTSAANNAWLSVCWSPELSSFVAVSESGAGNRVMTSAIGMPNSKSIVKALPSQVMVDANGNVGIGTMNPQAKLHVNGVIRNTIYEFRGFRSSVEQSGVHETEVHVQFDRDYDPYALWNSATFGTFYTVPVTGIYCVNTNITLYPFDTTTYAYMYAKLSSSSDVLKIVAGRQLLSINSYTPGKITTILNANANDRIRIVAIQVSSAGSNRRFIHGGWGDLSIFLLTAS